MGILHSKKEKNLNFKFATFDIESDDWAKFKLLGFFDGITYETFQSPKEFLDFLLCPKYYNYRIFAHFGGKFDFLFLIEHLGNRKNVQLLIINGKIIMIKIGFIPYKDKQNRTRYKKFIEFRDSYAVFSNSLKNLCDSFDTEHKKLEIDHEKPFDINDKQDLIYLKNDVFALYEVIKKGKEYINDLGGDLKLTAASCAMDLFQRKYLDKKIKIPTYFKYDEFIRSGYYGGRVEVFKKYFKSENGKKLNYYDVNSLYPSVMLKNFFPVGNPIEVTTYKKGDFGIFEIETEKINLKIPFLPQHTENKMYFKNGVIKGVYPSPYLEKLELMGIKFETKKGLIFSKSKIFEKYVSNIYEMRLKNKNNAIGYLCKSMLNSLYGKFGQKIERETTIINPDSDEITDLTLYDLDLDIWIKDIRIERNYILPAIAAFVTCYAQLRLYEFLDDSVYYCDTDSIFTEKTYDTSNDLGDLKLEDTITEAVFLSAKLYAFKTDKKEKIKAKGFNSNDLKFQMYLDALNGNLKNFKSEKSGLRGFKESIKSKDYKENGNFLAKKFQKKTLKKIDDKRQFKSFNLSEAFE